MNLFNQRQPKRFSYTPRHLKDIQKDNNYDFESKWRPTKQRKKMATLPILLIILGMVIVVWYVLSNYEI